MRPDRFTAILAAAVNRDGQLTAATYAEAGVTRSRWGLVLTGPVSADVQIVARSAESDDYSQPEEPVTGAQFPTVRTAAPSNLATVERYLAALAVAAAPAEVKTVDLYSRRDSPQAIRHGATFAFHSGAIIFLYITDPVR